jgi:hypothetical protein
VKKFNGIKADEESTVATQEATVRFPGLRRKGNVHQYRRRVPADLRDHYGKAEIVVTLNTQDATRARIRAAEEFARLETEFGEIRRGPLLKERIVRELVAPLRDPALTTEQKLDHIREGSARYQRATAEKLELVLDYSAKQVTPRPRTLLEAKSAFKRLRKLATSPTIAGITKADVIALRDQGQGSGDRRQGGDLRQGGLRCCAVGREMGPDGQPGRPALWSAASAGGAGRSGSRSSCRPP